MRCSGLGSSLHRWRIAVVLPAPGSPVRRPRPGSAASQEKTRRRRTKASSPSKQVHDIAHPQIAGVLGQEGAALTGGALAVVLAPAPRWPGRQTVRPQEPVEGRAREGPLLDPARSDSHLEQPRHAPPGLLPLRSHELRSGVGL